MNPGRKLPLVEAEPVGDSSLAVATDVPAIPVASPPGRRRAAFDARARRLTAYAVYAAVVVAIVLVWGVPEKRIVLIALVLALLLCTRIGRGRASTVRMLIDWLPFAAVLLIYDQSRRLGGHLGLPLHEQDIARAETWLFGGTDPTVWLQAHLHPDASVHWYDAAATLVYTSHFVATPALAAVLWLVAREAFLRFITRIVVMSVAALVTYMLFPAAPPWMASQDGYLGPVQRLSAQGWIYLHAGNLQSLLARAQDKGSNPVAAMPSVHTATAVLVAIALGGLISSRWRWLLALYPLAMAFALVYDGEHYALDLVAGAGYALAVHYAVQRWEQRRARHGLGPFDFVPTALRHRDDQSTHSA